MIAALFLAVALCISPKASDNLINGGVGPFAEAVASAPPAGFANTLCYDMEADTTNFVLQTDAIVGGYNRSNFTISVIFNSESHSSSGRGIAGQQGFSGNRSWYIQLPQSGTSTLTFNYSTNNSTITTITSPDAFVTGTTYHLVIVYDCTQADVADRFVWYTNGVAMAETGTGPPLNSAVFNSTRPIRLGSAEQHGVAFDGRLDEFALANGTRAVTDFVSNGVAQNLSNTVGSALHLWWGYNDAEDVDGMRTDLLQVTNSPISSAAALL